MFLNQGPDYYGDNEESAELLAEEDELARKGESPLNHSLRAKHHC